MSIPDETSTLGKHAAQRTVDLMPLPRWAEFRSGLARFFTDFPEGSGSELAAVDLGREHLLAATEEELETLRRAVMRSLSLRFDNILEHHPASVAQLRSLLETYAEAAGTRNTFTKVTQKAQASGNSQIYQAGGSQTIHMTRPGGRDDR